MTRRSYAFVATTERDADPIYQRFEEAVGNARKHKIRFKTAEQVFDDPFVLIYEDCEDESGEMRYHAVGRVYSEVLVVVVFVDRSVEGQVTYHIISARKAEDFEIATYADQF